MTPSRRQAGFSLAELAIVLTIIALLAAGIVVGGRALISRGEVSDLIAKIQDLTAAARDFRARYGYPPGDLPNAAAILTADGGVSAGCSYAATGQVGNGLVDTATERRCALEHLVKAGLIQRLDYDSATASYRIPLSGGATLDLGVLAATRQNAARITGLDCEQALELDRKLDTSPSANAPFSEGAIQALDGAGATLTTCVPGQDNDPVPTLVVRY
jgi:prepilin-type N-terminal cleavage/methylation domain-containing protein